MINPVTKIFFCTSNAGKVLEASELLAPYGVALEAVHADLIEPRDDDMQNIVLSKARQALELVKKPVLVEDTGIYFHEYKNFPGTYAKTFVTAVGSQGVLRLRHGARTRSAFFQTMVAFAQPHAQVQVFSGRCNGFILDSARGTPHEKLPYDSIFAPQDEKRCFAQMTKQEKAIYSHRAKAFRAFGEWLKK
jgi:XTP/dITP diphosphohydrolase